MSKFSGKTATANRRVRPTSPVRTTGTGVTHEGGAGFTRDPKSELFLLAVSNMGGEDTFYESGKARDDRFALLIHGVARDDPAWLAKFIPWLRDTANMRTASVVAAAEYAASGAPGARQVIASTLLRPDEPAELLGYWIATHGRSIPQPVKRGVADAAIRMYSERNLLKYDGQRTGFRFADVIELAHPKPKDDRQRDLFKHALDRRHNRDEAIPASLTMLLADLELQTLPEAQRRAVLTASVNGGGTTNALDRAGWTWERLSGWLPGGMDAAAWEAVIPQMGYMALLRNLRNFDEAKISDSARKYVVDKLSDPEEVAKSRQFPFRFLSAWKAAPAMHWGSALEAALALSCQNIPELVGRTLVLVDVSGSMTAKISQRSSVEMSAVGALFALATYVRSAGNCDLVAFGTDSMVVPVNKTTSVLRACETVPGLGNKVGHGTETHKALAKHYAGHDRVVIFTDGQAFGYGNPEGRIVDKIPVLHTFNLGGYRVTPFEAGKPGRHEFGGFSDSTFKLMRMVEDFQSAGWDALFGE